MANENVERLLIRAREEAEEAAEQLHRLEEEFYECNAEEEDDQVHFWMGFTEARRSEIKKTLRRVLEKLQACEEAASKEEPVCNCQNWAGNLNDMVEGHWPGCATLSKE